MKVSLPQQAFILAAMFVPSLGWGESAQAAGFSLHRMVYSLGKPLENQTSPYRIFPGRVPVSSIVYRRWDIA